MAGLTIDELLKGHEIRQNKSPKATLRSWLLDGYKAPFPRKIYAAIMAVAATEAKETVSFRGLKAYTLLIVAAGGSEDYFKGEGGFNTIEVERKDFSAEICEMKEQLRGANLPAAELADLIRSDLRKIEATGGLQLQMLAMSINDIAINAIDYMKKRKEPPCLKPLKDADKPRTVFYALIR